MAARKEKPAKRGPEADRLTLSGDWQTALAAALGRKKPETGWPKPGPRRKARKRAAKSKK
jgi:hypothetical protein